VTRGEKNRVTTAMAGLQMLHPNPSLVTLDKPAVVYYTDPATGLLTQVPGNLANYQVPTIRRFNPVLGKMQTYPDPTYKGRDNVVNFRVNGEDYAMVFNEQNERAMEVAKAFKNLGTPQLNGIMKAVAPYTRYLAAVNTQYNPIFGLVNFVRDAQYAMLTLSSTPLAGKQATVLKNAIGSLNGIYQDAREVRAGRNATSTTARMWQRFEHVGGPTGYRDLFFSAAERAEEIERMMNPTSLRGLTSPQKLGKRVEETALFKWLSDYNLTMENSIRLGVFKTGVDNGMSDLAAASLAKNITVNFNKKGQIGAQMGSLYAFFNANVQGTARILETLFERTPTGFRLSSVGKKIIVGGILLGVLQTFALSMAGFDDDDPPEFVKQKNLVIPMPGTEKGYLMIPMPLGFNLLPNVGRLAAEVVKNGIQGKPLDVMNKGAALFGTMYNTMSPVGGTGSIIQEAAPTVLDPFAALATNKDWTGKSIAKEDRSALDPTPGHTRVHDSATVWSRSLSKAINWATGGTDYVPGVLSPTPDQIDYLVQQATGGVGREVSKAAQVAESLRTGEELPTHKIPLIGRFVGSATGSSAIRSRFYEHVKAANVAYNEFEGRALHHEPFSEYIKTHPEARYSKVAITVQDDLAILQKQKRMMLEKGASRDAIRLQEERITGLMKRFNDLVEKAQRGPTVESP
jgi:conjugative element/phage-associated large polyvalent protein